MSNERDRSKIDFESPDDLAALYLAGAMTNEEIDLFESRLVSDTDLQSELRSLDGLGELLLQGIQPVQPARETKQSLLARIENDDAHNDEDDEVKPFISREADGEWTETGVSGVTLRLLFADQENKRMTCLMRLDPGSIYPSHVHNQAEECLVLEGDLDFGDYVLGVGDYVRLEAGTSHQEARTSLGCLCLITAELPDHMAA